MAIFHQALQAFELKVIVAIKSPLTEVLS